MTLCMVVLTIILGLFSYSMSSKQENPNVMAPVALLTCIYPGASPSDVEKLVTVPIEDEIRSVEGYAYSHSTSKKNVSAIVVWIDGDSDADKAWQQLRQKVDNVQQTLPNECTAISIDTDLADSAGIMVTVESAEVSTTELQPYAEKMKEKLLNIKGISKVVLDGEAKQNIEVIVDSQKLTYFSMSLEDIVKALAAENIEIPSGYIDDDNNKIMVNLSGGYQSLENIENTIVGVSKDNGSVLRMRDLAQVNLKKDTEVTSIYNGGYKGILVTGYFEKNKNILTMGKEVEKAIEEVSSQYPPRVTAEIVLFQPKEVEKAVNGFMTNLICGVLLVILVVWLGMSWRNAIIISTVIPLSILMTMIGMYLAKVPIHEISTAGLIISLGMLVDNAIVVSDAIQVRLDKGMERMEACVQGVKESSIPIFSSTATTIAAFIPLAMMSGVAGEYIYSVPFTVIVALIASYVNAMLVVPTLAFLFFKVQKDGVRDYLAPVRVIFEKLLNLGMANRVKTVGFGIGLMALAVVIMLKMGLSFFPYADKDIMHIKIASEGSGNIENTLQLTETVEKILKDQPEITTYTAAVGGGLPKFYITLDKGSENMDAAQIMMRIDLKNGQYKSNGELALALQKKIDKVLIGGTAVVKQLEHAEPAEAPVKLRIYGEDMDALVSAEDEMTSMMKKIQGTFNVRSDLRNKEFSYFVDLNRDVSSALGIANYDVQKQLNIALNGYTASVYRDGNSEHNIIVKGRIGSIEELQQLPIGSSVTGQKVYLSQIGKISLQSEFPEINHYDGQRSVTVFSDVEEGGSAVSIEGKIKQLIEKNEFGDVSFAFDGESAKISKYFGDAIKYAGLAILMIFLIMMMQFYSFGQPLIVMATMPLAVVGSIFGLFLCRQTLSFTALLGIISLMGIIVNNAILLIDFINKACNQGTEYQKAIRDSVGRRFRPIMLSTITTVIGLTPLAFSGSGLFTPMSIALISGLLVATMLTLVFIPVICSLVGEGKQEGNRLC